MNKNRSARSRPAFARPPGHPSRLPHVRVGPGGVRDRDPESAGHRRHDARHAPRWRSRLHPGKHHSPGNAIPLVDLRARLSLPAGRNRKHVHHCGRDCRNRPPRHDRPAGRYGPRGLRDSEEQLLPPQDTALPFPLNSSWPWPMPAARACWCWTLNACSNPLPPAIRHCHARPHPYRNGSRGRTLGKDVRPRCAERKSRRMKRPGNSGFTSRTPRSLAARGIAPPGIFEPAFLGTYLRPAG